MSRKRKKQPALRPLARRACRLRLAVYALLVTTVFTLPIYAAHIYSLHNLSLAERPHPASLALLDLADTTQTATFILAIILFLAWIRQAARNLQHLPGNSGPTPNPMHAATCWFIPLFNIYSAHQTLKRLYHGSIGSPPGPWPATQAINTFWAGWVISATIHLINYVPGQASAATTRQLLEPAYATLAANAVAVVALLYLLSITAEITQAQDTIIRQEQP